MCKEVFERRSGLRQWSSSSSLRLRMGWGLERDPKVEGLGARAG